MNDQAPRLIADHTDGPERGPTEAIEIEAFIDFICPRCYIAVRYLSDALAMFDHLHDVRIVWRSFQLDVVCGRSFDELLILDVMRNHRMKRGHAVDVVATVNTRLSELAARAGLVYEARTTSPGDTFAAHRVLQLAAAHGVADLAVERMQRSYFQDGMVIDDRESLAVLAAALGIDLSTARSVAFGDAYADAVLADRDRAERRGICSVPFFICDGRFVVSGTQSPRWLHELIGRCWDARCRESS